MASPSLDWRGVPSVPEPRFRLDIESLLVRTAGPRRPPMVITDTAIELGYANRLPSRGVLVRRLNGVLVYPGVA
jgi:hypothetical protein